MCANPTLRSQAPACLLHLGLPWRRGPEIIKRRHQASSIRFTRAESPATRSDLHNRNAPAAKPAQARLLPSPLTFLHLGRPTVVHRHGRYAHTAPLQSPCQQRMPTRRPSAHSTCIRLGIVWLPTPVQHKALLGYLQATSQGTDCGRMLLIPLLRTPTEPTLSYHILCPSRVINHPRSRRPYYYSSPHLCRSLLRLPVPQPGPRPVGR